MMLQYEIIKYRALAELRAEVRRGYLGMLWWILEPLLYMSVFYVLFAVGLRRGGPDFVPFLLTGLVAWKWFATSVNRGSGVLLANANLIRQVDLPKYMFPAVSLVVNTFKFFIVFVMLIGFLLWYGIPVTSTWLMVFIIIFAQLLFSAAMLFWVAALVPIIPDLKLVIENCLMLLFFISGVFFDMSKVEPRVQTFLLLNPMAWLIDAYRGVLLRETVPDIGYLAWLITLSCVLLYSGYRFLCWYGHEYPKIIR
jgi:lipopolysaccharide transport system permease protein